MKKKKIKQIKSEFYNHEIDEWVYEFRNDFNEQTKKLLGNEVFPKREVDIMEHIRELTNAMNRNPNEKIREELRVYQALHKGYGLGWYIAIENLGIEFGLTDEAKNLGISVDKLREKKAEEWDKKEEEELKTLFNGEPVSEEVAQKWKHEMSKNADGFWEVDPHTTMRKFIFSNPTPVVQDTPIEKSKWGEKKEPEDEK